MHDADGGEDEGEGDELFGQGYERDYQPVPHLDTYNRDELDDGALSEDEDDARGAAEREMNRRDRAGRGPQLYESDDEDVAPRRARIQRAEDAAGEEQEKIDNIEDTKGFTLLEWVKKPEIRREIKLRSVTHMSHII